MTKYPLFILLLTLASCNNSTSTKPADNAPIVKADKIEKEVTYPYAMNYSSKFKFIDPEKGKMVLDFWKDFDNNTLDNSKDILADTVTMETPKLNLKTSRDSILSVLKTYRKLFNERKTELDVIMSVASTDKGGDWVLVWATEKYTDKNKTAHVVKYQQVWGLNKAGKVNYIEQFDRSLK